MLIISYKGIILKAMDCTQDIVFHDDSRRALEKAKESILLMKKKMFRSHDLILQYNNKLKECERLKGDLYTVQEEANKLKRENNLNLSKVVKLEMQSADYKKHSQEQEQKIAKMDIQMASDKSHLQQLECKLEAVEDKHMEKIMEVELMKSSLEAKVKELEQELKSLKKSHLIEMNKLERALKSLKQKNGKKIVEVVKETKEIGVNTVEQIEQPKPIKTATVDKSILTNEFYNIQDNPYPLFCVKCESLMEPKVEKICQMMTHPPLVGDMSSPVRSRGRKRLSHIDSNCLSVNSNYLHCNESMNTDESQMNLNDASLVESNFNEINRVDPIPQNFVSPLPSLLMANSGIQEIQATPVDSNVPDLENLRRKVATLEREIKKQRKQKSSDSQPSSANCCSHPQPVNYCGHSTTHANPPPNVFPNMQPDFMTFFNRIMNVINERDLQREMTKVDSRRNKRTLRDKRAKTELRKLKKMKIFKQSKNYAISNWEVKSDDCDSEQDTENIVDSSNSIKPHLLRIKPNHDVHSAVTLFSDAASETMSPVKDPWEASFAETRVSPVRNVEESQEKMNRECDSNLEGAVKVSNQPKMSTRYRKRGKATVFGNDGKSEMEVELVKNERVENTKTNRSVNSTSNTRTRSKSLRNEENGRINLSVEKSSLELQNTVNSSWHAAINESEFISTDGVARDLECSVSSQNSAIRASVLDLSGADVGEPTVNKSVFGASNPDLSDVTSEMYSDSEPLELTNLRDRVELRKRKRSSSPKTTKRTGRSNLLGKLRALKKNSVMTVAKTTNSSTMHATRSLSRRKLTEQSESDDFKVATTEGTRTGSVSRDEPSVNVPVKKQRIAHVPRKATSPQPDGQELPVNSQISKLREYSDEVCEEKSTGDCTTVGIKRPLTRRLAVEKLAQSKSADINKIGLSVGVREICRRGRTPAKRKATVDVQLSLNSQTKGDALVHSRDKSPENEVNHEDTNETSVLPSAQSTDSSDITEGSLGDIGIEDNGVNALKIPEKEEISKFVATELAQAAKAEGLLTPSISVTDASIDKTGVARTLLAEKQSASLDAFPTSPDHSVISLDGVSIKPVDISISPSRSAVSSNAIAIEDDEFNKNFLYTRNSILRNEINAPSASTEFSINNASLEMSTETQEAIAQNADTWNKSKTLFNSELTKETISTIPDESSVSLDTSPASPDATPSSLVKKMESLTPQPIHYEERLSIYNNVALSIPLEETVISTALNHFSVESRTKTSGIYNKCPLQDPPSDAPIEKPIERNLLVYDTNLHDSSDDESQEFHSRNIANPQFFVDTAVVPERKDTRSSSDFVEPTNVVKKLRSRQVLCSTSTFENHQHLQKIQSFSNDEGNPIISSDAHLSQPDCYSDVRSLRTLLNNHLGEQKKKSATKAAKLRRAGAIKLQETAEKNVKVELEKLVESEEWTIELHQSVIAKLEDVRSERTLAKSIIDFLVERASFDEPLDRTYTPPAPVMTKTQQRIVTLINCLERKENTSRILDFVQTGIEFIVLRQAAGQPMEIIEYLFRVFAVISRIRKDRERVRILCCDAFYFIGRKAIPAIHVISTIWPEVIPKHGTVESEIPNCLAHMIKMEQLGNDPYPKIIALKKMITNYYEYPQTQALSAVVMKVLMKALHENYSNDLEAAILLVSKREGNKWALDNVIEKGLMKIIQDDNYQWKFEVLSLLGFILRTFPTIETDKSVQKFIDVLCQMLDSGEGTHDKQEGIVSALLSLSRYNSQFVKISYTILKWMPSRKLRALTLEQLDTFFKAHSPEWWNTRLRRKMKKNGVEQEK